MKKEENYEMKEAHPTKLSGIASNTTNTQSYITLADPWSIRMSRNVLQLPANS